MTRPNSVEIGGRDSRTTSSIAWRNEEPARSAFAIRVIVSGSCLLNEPRRLDLRRPSQKRGSMNPISAPMSSTIGLPSVGNTCGGDAHAGHADVLLIGALIGFMMPRFWLGRRKSSRLGSFNKQLPDTITLIANALRAGSSFLQAIELVVRESRPPISTEFGRVIREVNLGLLVRAWRWRTWSAACGRTTSS